MGVNFKNAFFKSAFLFSLFLFTASICWASTPLVYGDDLTAWINTEGESHTYTFAGTAGDRIFIRARGTSNGVDACIELFDPSGASVEADCDDGGYVTIDGYDLISTGTYTLTVKDHNDNDTGFYGLSLQIVNNPDFATQLNCEDDIVGALTHQAEIDAYTYSANAGDILVVRMRAALGKIESKIRLYDPAGNILAEASPSGGTSMINTFAIPADGTYTFLAYDNNGNDTGDYGFSIQVIDPNGCAENIGCGAFSADINSIAEMHAYTFEAVAGDRIYLNMRGSEGVEAELELYDATGVEIASDNPNGGTAKIENFVIPNTGDYFVMARDRKGNDIGSYGMSFQNIGNLNCSIELSCSVNLSASIDELAEMDIYHFEATAGEQVMLQMRATSSSLESEIFLYNSNGALIAEDSPGGGLCQIIETEIPEDGTYYVIVKDKHSNDIGAYGFSFQKLDATCATAFSCADGEVSGTFNSLTAIDAYHFTGNAGDIIQIDMIESGTELEPLLYVYDPNMVRIVDETASHDIHVENLEITETGTYIAMAMDRNGNDMGGYTLTIDCVPEENSTPPTIIGCADINLTCAEIINGGSLIDDWLNTVSAIDDIGTATITNNFDPNGFSCNGGIAGTQEVTFTATDDDNNVSTCSVLVTVVDNTAPEFDNAPAIINDITSGDNLPVQETLTATDLCGNATVEKSIDSYEVNSCGDYSITYRWTATDDCGTSSVVSSTFNVLLNAGLMAINCPEDFTLVLGEEGYAQLDAYDLWGFENECAFEFFHEHSLYFTCDDAGTNQITFSVLNDNQILVVCDLTITVDASNCAAAPEYCDSWGTASGNKYIQSLSIGDYSNYSGSDGGYGDYTNEEIELAYPSAMTIELGPSTNDNSKRKWGIWIDYNQDGEFSNDEKAFSISGKGILYGTINIPEDVEPGATRIRVSMKTGWAPGPCGTFSAGEVEDYTVIFTSGSNFGGMIPDSPTQSNKTAPIIKCFPNPTTDYVMVDISKFNTKNGIINIYNSSGEQVWSSGKQLLSDNVYQVDIKTLKVPAGIYKVAVIYGKKSVSRTIYVNNE